MPNAKDIDINQIGKPKIILVGSGGAGKTSQILTLPGKTFAYLFDPSALSAIRGFDVEYETFFATHVDMAAKSLTKNVVNDKSKAKEDASQVYVNWEADFEKKTREGFWDTVDNVVLDSFTTFSDVVMDRILKLNGRPGQFPQQDDWTAQMSTIMNVVRTFAGMNKLLLCTAHDNFKQDEATSRMQNVIMLTGQLRVKLPLLFSEILHLEHVADTKGSAYRMQTRPDRMNPNIRTSMRGVEMYEDITITDWKNPTKYGLGKLLKDKLGYTASTGAKSGS
jgi:hypothetical protein